MLRVDAYRRPRWLLGWVLIVGATAPILATAEQPDLRLSLERAEALLLSQAHIDQRLAAARARAVGEQRAANRWANPELELSNESVSGAGQSEDERSIWLRQPIDLSGERGRRRLAAVAHGEARLADTQSNITELNQQVRGLYFDALYWQNRTRLLADARLRIERLMTTVSEQVARGETAQYDLLRLEQQLVSVSGREASSAAQAEQRGQQLLALLGLGFEHHLTLTDPLLPPAPPTLSSLLEKLPALPALRAAEARRTAAQAELRAEQRAGIPDVTLGLGHRTIESNGLEQDGVLLALQVPLPLFDRRSGQREIAASDIEAATAELTALQQHAEGDVRGLWAAATRLREQALRVNQDAQRTSSALLVAAETGYAEAELSVLQLTDAMDTALTTLMNAQDLTRAARAAHTELHRYTWGKPND